MTLKATYCINDAYQKRISLATSDLIIDTNKKEAQEQQAEFTRLTTIVELLKRGDEASLQTAAKLRTFGEAVRDQFDRNGESTLRYYTTQAHMAKYHYDVANSAVASESQKKASDEYNYTIDDAYKLAHNQKAMADLFGADKNGKLNTSAGNEFVKMAKQITRNAYGQYRLNAPDAIAFAGKLRDLMNPANTTAKGDGNGNGNGNLGGGTAKGIAGGGPRTININGVKFMDKFEMHVTNMKEGREEMEHMLQDMFLRVLNSGASVQG